MAQGQRRPPGRAGAPGLFQGTHKVGGHRRSNQGRRFERMFVFDVVTNLIADQDEAFSVATDNPEYGMFQDVIIRCSDRDNEGSLLPTWHVQALELKHSQRVLHEGHFQEPNGKYPLVRFYQSFLSNRGYLDTCVRVFLATNNAFTDPLASNFHGTDGHWLLDEADTWRLRENSSLTTDLGRPCLDRKAFCDKFRVATGLPEPEALKTRILRRLDVVYGSEARSEMRIKTFYLHLKEKFEMWFDENNRFLTYQDASMMVREAMADIDT